MKSLYRASVVVIATLLTALVIVSITSQAVNAQDTGVFAEAQTFANLRAFPGTDAAELGQIDAGTRYPVIGQSELYPWVLLGDPQTQRPIGWVYEEILDFRGDKKQCALLD